jgi:hypothetical protein
MVNTKTYRKYEGQAAVALESERFRHWPTWCWYSAFSFSLTMVNSKCTENSKGNPLIYLCVSDRFRYRLTGYWDSASSFSLTVVISKINRKIERQSAAAPVCRNGSDTVSLGTGTVAIIFR